MCMYLRTGVRTYIPKQQHVYVRTCTDCKKLQELDPRNIDHLKKLKELAEAQTKYQEQQKEEMLGEFFLKNVPSLKDLRS